ncbi:hypothetical protein PoB_006152100 [Plakobranchus ocellatus]|uniref:Uncharacterized protein n=1 Tax=Plakobranchus ocellatus TaxID=259542 RepID=A0AAV4CT16_9GAST|nr:hypothetical protein PoB_006152100 [Plakobranchus ocellatus]
MVCWIPVLCRWMLHVPNHSEGSVWPKVGHDEAVVSTVLNILQYSTGSPAVTLGGAPTVGFEPSTDIKAGHVDLKVATALKIEGNTVFLNLAIRYTCIFFALSMLKTFFTLH